MTSSSSSGGKCGVGVVVSVQRVKGPRWRRSHARLCPANRPERVAFVGPHAVTAQVLNPRPNHIHRSVGSVGTDHSRRRSRSALEEGRGSDEEIPIPDPSAAGAIVLSRSDCSIRALPLLLFALPSLSPFAVPTILLHSRQHSYDYRHSRSRHRSCRHPSPHPLAQACLVFQHRAMRLRDHVTGLCS